MAECTFKPKIKKIKNENAINITVTNNFTLNNNKNLANKKAS